MAKGLLPYQYHRAKGTIKVDSVHKAKVKDGRGHGRDKPCGTSKRSPKWSHFREKYLKQHRAKGLGCEACGAKRGLALHHRVPFNTDPTRELDPTNIVVLCMYTGGLLCHLELGHSGDYKKYNPKIDQDAAALMRKPELLETLHRRALKRALPNKPLLLPRNRRKIAV